MFVRIRASDLNPNELFMYCGAVYVAGDHSAPPYEHVHRIARLRVGILVLEENAFPFTNASEVLCAESEVLVVRL